MKIKIERVVSVQDWDELVKKTYGKNYSFQQQNDCRDRGIFRFTVPSIPEDYNRDSVPEIVNDKEMGVSFKSWLHRDPNQPLSNGRNDYGIKMWWERNFYPDISMVANDLHEKGLLESGDYTIYIDW